jgi:hypothetical protein
MQSLRIDARVIAATTKDLSQVVDGGHFNADVFYRLNRFQLMLPPLRERRGDALLLADHLFETNVAQRAPNVRDFSNEAREAIDTDRWPGNVTELISRVTKAMISCSGRLIAPSDLGLAGRQNDPTKASLEAGRLSADRDLIVAALERNGNNMAQTARQLGISRVTLYRLVSKLRITRAKVKRSRGAVRGRGPWIFTKKVDLPRLPLPHEATNGGGRRSSEVPASSEMAVASFQGTLRVDGTSDILSLGRGKDERNGGVPGAGPPRVIAAQDQTGAELVDRAPRANLKAG